MQPALDSTTLDRLISLGREQGFLTTEDLRASLPVEQMSAVDIALVVVQLEGTGIAVELEESLLSPHPEHAPMPRQSAVIIPFPGPRADRRKPQARSLRQLKIIPPEPPQTAKNDTPFSGWIVAAAGALAFALFSLVIYAAAS